MEFIETPSLGGLNLLAGKHARSAEVACESAQVRSVMGSSNEVHVVDALAITGEEGRGSLRKAAGSWQTSDDPQMSEWGNPAHS